jgi:predicted CoA-binding protein
MIPMAVANKLARKGYPIVNVGRKKGEVAGVEIEPPEHIYDDIDTITVYVGPQNQSSYTDYILKTKPKRVIFNPGAENPDFAAQLQEQGVETIEACTLVMLNTGQY